MTDRFVELAATALMFVRTRCCTMRPWFESTRFDVTEAPLRVASTCPRNR